MTILNNNTGYRLFYWDVFEFLFIFHSKKILYALLFGIHFEIFGLSLIEGN